MTSLFDPFGSERLLFELRKPEHAPELFELFCDKDLYEFICRDIPPSVEWLAEGFNRKEDCASPDGKEIWFGWVTKNKKTGDYVGLFEASIIKETKEVYLAYTVFKKYWRQGFCVEAINAIIEHTKKHFSVTRFVIEMDTRNRASVKVAEKLGFDFVKVKNNACFLKNLVSHEFQFQKLIQN